VLTAECVLKTHVVQISSKLGWETAVLSSYATLAPVDNLGYLP